jgi:hypothetical protein
VVCRYCGHEFGDILVAESAEASGQIEKSRAGSRGPLIGVGILFALLIFAAFGSGRPSSSPAVTANDILTTNEVLTDTPGVSSVENMLDAPFEPADTPTASLAETTNPMVPDFNTEGYCRKVSEIGGTGSYTIEETCRGMEADARSQLAARTIPNRVYQHCKQVAEVGGYGSYNIMNTCVDMELESAGRL